MKFLTTLATILLTITLASTNAVSATAKQDYLKPNIKSAAKKVKPKFRLRPGVRVPGNREKKLFVGKNATETTMTFDGTVVISGRAEPTKEKALSKIEDQVGHLFGPMSAAEYPAVPKGDHRISGVKISRNEAGAWAATYHYSGTVLVHDGPKSKYSITLPVNPDNIYEKGMVLRGRTPTYPCTDHHYDTKGDFWYFWNPQQTGCKLEEGVNYVTIDAKIDRIDNTKLTYPDYSRMADTNGEVQITILMGMDDVENSLDPHKSADINAGNYKQVYKSLTNLGFKPTGDKWTTAQIKEVVSVDKKFAIPTVEELKKDYRDGDKVKSVVVRMFFGPSGIDEDSTAFHYFYRDALANSSVMIYDGHSGLGSHLDPAGIEEAEGFKIKFSKSKYQIYFFNSCTSYTYYNANYFERKGGSKNLDIMLNGLATAFAVMHDTDMTIIKAIDNWATDKATLSYQELAPKIDSDNLFGVAGDEDNPTTAPN